jgi:hypothetical protein
VVVEAVKEKNRVNKKKTEEKVWRIEAKTKRGGSARGFFRGLGGKGFIRG